jgi:hypothetical protein
MGGEIMNRLQAKGEIIARVKVKEQEKIVEACVSNFDEADAYRKEAWDELQASLDKYLELINFKEEEDTDAVHTEGEEGTDGPDSEGDGVSGSDG